ncbi:16S rRNA (guanine(527)-N(7))-methyltransferase RsmG [Nitrosovibrio sp. Nv17]|uniref:16S rRNA (guanine(527)-N(7))-methyltransferase RsmG n=1 Tax=Nitrosovibrio sp. Nv17 TaxID=1855339 RepID=UPI00090878C2|nr:16S rRNA (guanine(527)-N(7))-methyltransferase RsmG [Nitrosovibrio sp. Nv17]SFW22630.1 16S rRNA m(7)G-527 methyltransferase [Nitrosovibrio sp. Nv17]
MLAKRLDAGLEILDGVFPKEVRGRLLKYLALIGKWNQVYNLTAVRDPEMMLVRHLFDSLAVLPHVAGPRVADVGSGAGLPGIPLALARPDWQVTLIESSHKKTVFLRQMLIELELGNAEVTMGRVEASRAGKGYDTVISRAFSDLCDFIRLAGHLVAENGRMVAMKGIYPHEELAQIPASFVVENVFPITVPGLDAERHLVMIHPAPAATGKHDEAK